MRVNKKILIGIYWPPFAGIKDVLMTLDTIELSTGNLLMKVLILADGNKNEADLRTHIQYTIISNDILKGKAYCFNQLIAYDGPDYFVFLEAGILLGPDCLSLLINALEHNIQYGLAGPSINPCWNEQGSLPSVYLKGNYRQISGAIRNVFKEEYAELFPLYSLSDCCYVVKKEVIDNIGIADEAYGIGSCWEMDFNIRATRSGFKGIWVKGAFAERTLDCPYEDLQYSKKVYQTRFCALQKNPHTTNYKQHCLGDACSNFAVLSLIKLKFDFIRQRIRIQEESFSTLVPSVSCIMPTAKRAHFVAQAIQFFNQQDYLRKELITVYNEDNDIPVNLELRNNIKLIKSKAIIIGDKRNEACKHAKGNIIVQWDDDDIYQANRISVQVLPLLKGECEITGLNNFVFHEINTDKYWICTEDLFKKLFVENVAGGTLVYLRSVWQNDATYPSISLREDSEFLTTAMKKGARLQRIDGKHVFMYLRHSDNTWRFKAGTYLIAEEWLPYKNPENLEYLSVNQ